MSHQIRLRPLTFADQREPIEAGLFDDLTKSNGGDRNAGAKLAVQAAAHEVIVDTESDGGGPYASAAWTARNRQHALRSMYRLTGWHDKVDDRGS
jgi:hypothetical protein